MKREDLSQAEIPVLLIPVNEIDVSEDRLRSLKPGQADAIGAAILADGQYDPITVAQLPGQSRFVLVDGLHRLEGCKRHGIALIEARIGSADRTARRRQEVLSAWARADHDVFDKAAQVAEMVELAKLDPGEVEDASIMMILGGLDWEETVCETLGIGRASMFRHLKLHRFFQAEDKDALRKLGLAADLVPLLRLSALPPYDFTRAWAALEAGEAATIAEALALVAVTGLELKWEKASRSIVSKVADWPSMYRKRLLETLLKTYDRNGNPLERDA